MPTDWTIAGEAGKVIDATPRPLAALQAQGAEVAFNSLDTDRMTWTIWLRDAAQAETLVPEKGQRITLYRNGVRYFTGLAKPRIRLGDVGPRVEMTVEGPWWWLKQMPLSSDVPDQSGAASERTAFVFPTGSPRTYLQALIHRAMSLGAPIQEGSIASCFPVPRLSLRNIPFSEAIAEVMRWVADGMVYFDYSVEGHPALCMQRRVSAPVVTLTPGVAVVSDVNVEPRLDLQAEELAVFYARRETVDGKRVTVWDSQTAAVETPSGLPRRQAVLVSGPEIDTYLPQDFTDSMVVRSLPIEGGGLAALLKRQTGANLAGTSVGPKTYHAVNGLGSITLQDAATTVRRTDSDAPLPGGSLFVLVEGTPATWWAKAGIEHYPVAITATISQATHSPENGHAYPTPEWAEALGVTPRVMGYGTFTWWGGGPRPDTRLTAVFAYRTTINAVMVRASWGVPTLVIRPEDYAFIHPPEGLAANLLATQNWLPYEGTVGPFVAGEIPANHSVGGVLNIPGSLPDLSNMRSLIVGHAVRLATEAMTYRVGAPTRYAYRDLVNRFRQSGADNIVWLVDSVSGNPEENPPPDPELQIPADVPDNALTFDEDFLTWNGAYLEWADVPENALAWGGDFPTWNEAYLEWMAGPDGALAFQDDLLAHDDNHLVHSD